MTHSDLVKRAEKWLRNSAVIDVGNGRKPRKARCGVVLCEPSGWSEEPDAIGWLAWGPNSILVECKASRADFLRDKKKPARLYPENLRMGTWRFYMAPKDLISVDEIPDGWGLLEVCGRVVRVKRHAVFNREHGRRAEMSLLLSECRKIQIVENGGNLEPTRSGKRITRAIRHTFKDGAGI